MSTTAHRIDTHTAGPVLSRIVVTDDTGEVVESVDIMDTGRRKLAVLGAEFARRSDAFALAYEYVWCRYRVRVSADAMLNDIRAMRDGIAEQAAERLAREVDTLRAGGYHALADDMAAKLHTMRTRTAQAA